MLVEMARIGGSEQARIERGRLTNAADLARQHIAIRLDPVAPAALGLLCDGVHASRQPASARFALGVVGPAQWAQSAGQRRLLDQAAIIARMQAVEQVAKGARLLDQRPQVLAEPL